MQNDIQIILYQLSSGSGMISTFYTSLRLHFLPDFQLEIESLGSSSAFDLIVSELSYIFEAIAT